MTTVKWWTQYNELISSNYLDLIDSESQADIIQEVDCIIPGLLQTERYAHAVITAMTPFNMVEADVKRLVDVRMHRQWHTFERPDKPKVHIVLDESALHRCIGGREVMREQLRHLLSLTQQPNITVQIIPFSAAFHAGWHHFTIHQKNGMSPWQKVYIEDNLHGNSQISGSAAIANYRQIFTTVQLVALREAASIHSIEKVLQQLERRVIEPTWQS